VAIEDAGWEIRDCVMWVYGSGFPKSHDVSKAIDKAAGAEREVVATIRKTPSAASENMNEGWRRPWAENAPKTMDITAPATDAARQWSGWGTALKPAWEPIIVARKPLRGTVAGNVLEWGTGGINVDGCRIGANGDKLDGGRVSTKKEGWDRPWKHDAKAVADCIARGTAAVEKAEQLGRWPANLIHDGSEEVTDLLVDAARFFYCPKASKRDRDEGLRAFEEQIAGGM
jgi:site-specific DNA-methyltransferase (adenine-specific)